MSYKFVWLAVFAALFASLSSAVHAQTNATQSFDSENNNFGINLFKELVASDNSGGNVVISPMSVSQALGLLYIGAAGTTKSEIGSAMDISEQTDSAFEQGNLTLLSSLESTDPTLSLSVANAVWSRKGEPLSARYRVSASHYFLADISSLDFGDPDEAAGQINDWVSGKTGGKINEMVNSAQVKGASTVLTNAVYFNGSWTDPFDPSKTAPTDFTLADGSTEQVPTMYREGSIAVYQDPSVTAISLPYSGSPSTSMVIVMPGAGQSLGALVGSLDAGSFDNLVGQMSNKVIRLYLPKFQGNHSQELVGPLEALGVRHVFTHDADLSPMGLPLNYVSDVFHKAVVDVDEQGTVAAGATGVVIHPLAIMLPRLVRIDHPFLYAIRDNQSGAILFLGEMSKPAAT